jgi:hypothetical protein
MHKNKLKKNKFQDEKKFLTPEGIEPPIFGSGIRRVTIAPWSQSITRSASVAQWIEHQTSNLGVAGSSPA